MNPITKAHLEGVEHLENTFLVEEGIKQREVDVHIRYDVVKRFLTTYGINLLNAAKEAGPGEKEETLPYPAIPSNSERSLFNQAQGHNSCRTSFHSAIDEGIEGIENI